MRNKSLIILVLLLIQITGYCLTENSKISILTAEPGSELYTIFGHTAIRITDESLNIDRIYNFGTFDFSSPFFYIKFLKGNLDYFLSISDFNSYKYYSVLEHRKIYEQILNFSFTERLKVSNALERCYASDDRFYKYDFFYDNCATRVRDVIFNAKNGKIQYDTSLYCCQTFRQLLKPYISKNYWIDLGVNLFLGKEADRLASSNDFMFLPDNIKGILQNSETTKSSIILFDTSDIDKNFRRNSVLILWLVISLIACLSIIRRTRLITFYFYNSLVSIVGLFLLFLNLISDNSALTNNMNILWTFPALIIILIFNTRIRKKVEILYVFLLLFVIVFRGTLYHGFSSTFLPWIILLIMVYVIDLQWIKQIKTFANIR